MRRSLFVVCFGLIAVVASAAVVWLSRGRQELPLSPRNAAEQLLADCQWQAAVDACDALLSETPEDGEVWFWRGRGRLALGQYEDATADFTQAIVRLPKEAEPRYFRAMAYERLENYDLANADYDAARELDPKKDSLRTAIRDAEASRAVENLVRDVNRAIETRSTKRQTDRATKAAEGVAALGEESEPPASSEQTQKQFAVGRSATDAGAALRPGVADHSTFEKLTSENMNGGRLGSLASLPAAPQDLLAPPAMDSAASAIAGLGALGRNRFTSDPAGPPGLDKVVEPPTDTVARLGTSPNATPAPTDSSNASAPPLSAWEQFQQRQASRPSGDGPAGARRGVLPFFASPGQDRSEGTETDLGEAAQPKAAGKYPVKPWSPLGESPLAGNWQFGPLAARAKAGEPLSTAQPLPNRPRGPESVLSTAMVPLPSTALDLNAARASSPPGLLSTALHELVSPTAAKTKPPLATHTAPLPEWTTPPESALPKRR